MPTHAETWERPQRLRPKCTARLIIEVLGATVMVAALILANGGFAPSAAIAAQTPARIVVLMVWDGLRPDLVTAENTPNLLKLEQDGVRFDHHHSAYPTLTMVNASVLATGALPGASGILGNSMYLVPALAKKNLESDPVVGALIKSPLDLEKTAFLMALDGPNAFAGHLLGLTPIGQRVRDDGGYVAVIGKAGPTFLFDDQALSASGQSESAAPKAGESLFISDDLSRPADAIGKVSAEPPLYPHNAASVTQRDAWFASDVVEQALPAAMASSAKGQPALVVFWQHNPDLVQHVAGLGTQDAIDALRADDANLARLQGAITALGISGRTDLMVVSDHGFATLKRRVGVAELLVAAGIKRAADSDDIVVVKDGASDLIYLSRADFPTAAARRAVAQRITDFAEAQEWCGPIFSTPPAADPKSWRGSVRGTFSQALAGDFNPVRSPDLLISFRELPDEDNSKLTGPANPAFAIVAGGVQSVPNHSKPLLHPVAGTVYADVGRDNGFTTGMGIHGAAGLRELHNVCAAAGPDFRTHFADPAPSGNADITPTIAAILGLPPAAASAGESGRVLNEALVKQSAAANQKPRAVKFTTELKLKGETTVSSLSFTRFGGESYLDGATVTQSAAGAAQ